MNLPWELVLAVAIFALSAAACALAQMALRGWTVFDRPNERSSHTRPLPRGGGAGFIFVILLAWTWLRLHGDSHVTIPVLLGAAAIALVSFADDLRGVSPPVRLFVQAAAIAGALAWFPFEGPLLAPFLPLPLDRVLLGITWLWFVNLFNFMDGIDGLAITETVIIVVGLILFAALHPGLGLPTAEGVVVGAAALAFLLFNWPPARLFMGDVGSTGLGFLLGWLLILGVASGALIPAVLLPLYFVADATTTLVLRAWRRQPLWEAHRGHAYQRAVDAGLSHRRVTSMVVVVDIGLVVLGLAAFVMPLPALVLGLLLVLGFIFWLRRR